MAGNVFEEMPRRVLISSYTENEGSVYVIMSQYQPMYNDSGGAGFSSGLKWSFMSKVVHVAGTKGKGSIAAFLSNILRAERYSISCYTIPYIQTLGERISVGRLSEPVSAKSLNYLFQRIKTILDQAFELENGYISHFEELTIVAFRIFADENIDVVVIEAGLAASVITTIGEEHLAALGGSLESNAMAKSRIIKSGCPLVLRGPFLWNFEHILRGKASLMGSLVVSASDLENISIIKGINNICGKPCQSCDIVLEIDRVIKMTL